MNTWLRTAVLAVAVGVAAPAGAADPAGVGGSPLLTPADAPTEVLDLTPPVLPGRSPPITSDPLLAQPGGWFATADYLIWRPRLSDSAYALVDPRNDLTPQGGVRRVDFDARSGLRVGAGYRLPGRGWDVGVTYTYLHSSGDSTAAARPGGVVYPLLTRPGVIDQATRAVGAAGLDYQVFDLDFGKTIAVDPAFTVRAFGGVRFADIDVDLGAGYDGLLANRATAAVRSAFRGAGPTAGAEGRLSVWRGLSLFGTARGGLLYGTFDGHVREANAGGLLVTGEVCDRFSGVAPVASVALGGSWAWRTVTVTAGYEVTHWFNLAARPTFFDDFAEGKVLTRRSDLSLDGVFVRIGLQY